MSVTWYSREDVLEMMRPGCHMDGTATIGLRAWLALQ
jgi:hypothetical protein